MDLEDEWRGTWGRAGIDEVWWNVTSINIYNTLNACDVHRARGARATHCICCMFLA